MIGFNRYDGDETSPDAKANAPVAAEAEAPTSFVPATAETRTVPGYGEEPDTAGPPDSFEEAGNDDHQQDSVKAYGEDFDQPMSTTGGAYRNEPLQMKEDG